MRILLLILLGACAGSPARPPEAPAAEKKFSMRTYQMALLRRGPSWTAERTPAVQELGKGHMANIQRLAADGKLLIAGPFELDASAPRDSVVGIFIFDVASKEEAVALVQSDPAIAAGHFAAEVLPWFGPSGLTYDGREAELAKLRAKQ